MNLCLNICEHMYIHKTAMTELRKCSRCKSEIELTYFGINRKGEP